MNTLIRANDANSAATHHTAIAAIRRAGNIAMAMATANASGAATRPRAAIAATRPTASMSCKSTQRRTKNYEKTIGIFHGGGCCSHN